MAQEIKLTCGTPVLVDDEDFVRLNAVRWYISQSGGYAVREYGGKCVFMHRRVLGLGPKGKTDIVVDHINRNKLDNRKTNLRVVTGSINAHNTGLRTCNVSGVGGVYWHKQTGRWSAMLGVRRYRHFLGLFDSVQDGAEAVRIARIILGVAPPQTQASAK